MHTHSKAQNNAANPSQQLSFQLINTGANPDGVTNVIYITDDATYNKLTLQFMISSGSTELQPGEITPPPTPPTEGSVFYLDLSGLQLSNSVFNALSFSAAGWKFQTFPDSVVGMTPTEPVTLSSTGGGLSIEIGNMEVTRAIPPPVQLYVTYYGVSGVQGMYWNFQVALMNSPVSKGNLADVIAVSLSSNQIINSCWPGAEVQNGFTLQFAPGVQPTLVNAGPDTLFTVSFVYGQPKDHYGYGALTSAGAQGYAANIHASPGLNAGGWLITTQEQQESPSWTLQPPNGVPIVAEQAVVGINFADIVTKYQPGPTVMLVSYTNVPGYSDGAFSILLEKVAHVYINSISASPNPAVLSAGQADVTISWDASAPNLTLMPGPINVSGLSEYQVEISGATTFTLIAQGEDVRNWASADVKVDILPIINSISAQPQNIYYQDFPHDLLLDWSVDTDGTVVLTNSVNSDSQTFPASFTTGETVSGPLMFTLAPSATDLPLSIRRNECISAFKLNGQNMTLQGNPLSVAVAPLANIYAVAESGSDSVTIMESITNTAYGPAVLAGKGPACLMFSHDGKYLFVGNGTDNTLSVIGVTFDSASDSYTFNKLTDVTLSGSPSDVDVASDDSYIFVTTNGSKGNLDVIKNDGAGNFFVKVSLEIGASVDGVAAIPSYAQVFVASAAGASVSVVGYSSISDSFMLVSAIGGFQADDSPVDVAIAAQDASTLLIACKGSNSVYAVNKDVSSVAGKQNLTVGGAPVRVITTEEGSYAYVANSTGNTVSLISCFKGSGFCRVLENSLAAGTAPGALAASGDGTLIYVANTGAASVTVFNMQTYAEQGVEASIAVPTSVAASERWVASWHNFDMQIGGPGTPAPGLSVYDRNSQTVTTVNASTQYVDLKFWPDPSLKRALATVHGANELYVLETDKFTTVTTIPLSGSASCRPAATSISSWGNVAFALTADIGGVFKVTVIECDAAHDAYNVVAQVDLFTETAASAKLLAPVSDGSAVFITDSFQQKMYAVSKNPGGMYELEPDTYSFILPPNGLACAPDDSQLYIWMNQGPNAAFARFDIQGKTLENFILPGNVSLQVNALVISPDGARLFMTDSNFGGVRCFSTASMQNIENIKLTQSAFPIGLAVAPDASELYAANAFAGNFSVAKQLQPETSPAALASAELSTGQDYQGIFLRDYIGETPTSGTGSGWTSSPDIVPYGTQLMAPPNPPSSVLGDMANYNTDYGSGQIITPGQFNNVYVRGLNTAPQAQTSRVYFYWVNSTTVLWPSQWSPYNFQFNNNLQNWLDITAQANGAIAYSPAPLSWKPSTDFPHYCLIAWVDNSSNPTPPDLSQYANFSTWDQLGQFIMSHPNVAWRNTVEVPASTQFMNAQTIVAGPAAGGSVTVGVYLVNCPMGGTIQFTLINSDCSINYNSPVQTINTNTFSQTIQWPANAPDPVLTYTYVPAGGTLQGSEQITAFTSFMPPTQLLKRALLRHRNLSIRLFRHDGAAVVEMVLGTVKFRYTPS
jgi:DNA-binding beta-propeller fold protein YncE